MQGCTTVPCDFLCAAVFAVLSSIESAIEFYAHHTPACRTVLMALVVYFLGFT